MARPVYIALTAVGSTPWQLVNYNAQPVNLTIAVVVTGSVTYTVEYTYDDIMGLPNPTSYTPTTPSPVVFSDPILAGATATGETTFNDPILAWRVTMAGGSTGSLAIKAIQAGIIG